MAAKKGAAKKAAKKAKRAPPRRGAKKAAPNLRTTPARPAASRTAKRTKKVPAASAKAKRESTATESAESIPLTGEDAAILALAARAPERFKEFGESLIGSLSNAAKPIAEELLNQAGQVSGQMSRTAEYFSDWASKLPRFGR